jgi:hypothetical protein
MMGGIYVQETLVEYKEDLYKLSSIPWVLNKLNKGYRVSIEMQMARSPDDSVNKAVPRSIEGEALKDIVPIAGVYSGL